MGSRRGDFNCVQYGIFPYGYTRRGKEYVLYFMSLHEIPLLLVVSAYFYREGSACCVYELSTEHGKVTRGCNRGIISKTYSKSTRGFVLITAR